MKSLLWKAYYPIPHRARVPREDAEWFAARGIDREMLGSALAVLRVVRREVLPLHTHLRNGHVESFLVHDRASGVPAPKKDDGVYLDATLSFLEPTDARKTLKKWKFVRPAKPSSTIAGVDASVLLGKNVSLVDLILRAQADLMLDILAIHEPRSSDVAVLKHLGQFLHYFSNMTQLVIR